MKKAKQSKRDLKIKLTPEEFCPIRETVRLLGKQWTILIIKEIYYARYHRLGFMDLSRKLKGASSKVLSERLKEMIADGIVRRKEKKDETPMRVFYYLTPKGKDACKLLVEFKKFGIKWGELGTVDCSKVNCELCPAKED